MYEKHFSFKHKPFDLVPNPDFLFLSSTHQKAITYLDYGIKEKIGFILLTGEIGSGKTTILRNLIKSLNGSVRISRISNTKVSSEQLISMINEDFGLDIEGKSKTRLLSELNAFLIDQYAKKIQPVLLIDEAQNLSADLLEEIRMLSNLETDRAKLLQIILVGQPELKKTLMLAELMQLRQRINISYHIAPLNMEETGKYIIHRLTVAGNPGAMKIQDDMLQMIYQFSRGIPRLINILCDFSLLTAYVEGAKEVSGEILKAVAKDLDAYDYWSERSNCVSEKIKEDKIINTDEIAKKFAAFEEVVKSSLTTLSERVAGLEEEVSKLPDAGANNNMIALSERVKMLEQLSDARKNDSKAEDDEAHIREELHIFAKQIGSLTDTVSGLNRKIRKTIAD
ncbi:MAG: AAA family ATPase [Nitrospirae bacterium]|nr:AAA family ATPase [Nitrospirota bacterium]